MNRVIAILAALAACAVVRLDAQRGANPGGPPIDLTGYWVSIVTQDWRWRMVTPAKGDYLGIPINADAKKVADAWDPAKDEAAGEQCKSYGAPALMSVPGRLHITWQDNRTLKIDTDAGTQTRVVHIGEYQAPAGTARSWQGVSLGQWQTPEQIAALVVFLASTRAATITGQTINVDGGWVMHW